MAKFRIGEQVHCFRKECRDFQGFDFVGEVMSASDTGEGVEYSVSNAPQNRAIPRKSMKFPLLIWESEMEAVNVPIK